MEHGNRKERWLIYTVLVGLIPIVSRLLIWALTKPGVVEIFSPSDFIAFGLILHISNINEIEHADGANRRWKTIQNGISIMFIVIYSVLYPLILVGSEIIDPTAVSFSLVALSIASLIVSYSVLGNLFDPKSPSAGAKP